jgi:hypothetical protein
MGFYLRTDIIQSCVEAGFKATTPRHLQTVDQLGRPPFTPEKKNAGHKPLVTIKTVGINVACESCALLSVPQTCGVTSRTAMRAATDKKQKGNFVGNFLKYDISKGIAHGIPSTATTFDFKHI